MTFFAGLWIVAFVAFIGITSHVTPQDAADWQLVLFVFGSLFSLVLGLKLDAKRRG